MPPLSMLIKPASSLCNLKCSYCFYHSLADNRGTESYGMMSESTLEVIVKKALEFSDGSCNFAFQGGEPTLAGLGFFKKLIEFQKKYNNKKVKINNIIQTNGMLIDEEWAEFLSQNKFLAGLSLDGTKDFHDMNRINSEGKGSFGRVMNAVRLFNKFKIEYNILCVVNSSTAGHVLKISNFFKKNNFNFLQFIPCLDPLNELPGGHDYSLSPNSYASFLKTLFDIWYNEIINGGFLSIQYFDNLIGMLIGGRSEVCGMSGRCTCQFVIEADGGVYPCDFYAIDKWHLGNIIETGFEELKNSDKVREFEDVSCYIDPECKKCEWLSLCRGGCRRQREPFMDGKPVRNYFCEAYKEFFEYSVERLKQIAIIIGRQRV